METPISSKPIHLKAKMDDTPIENRRDFIFNFMDYKKLPWIRMIQNHIGNNNRFSEEWKKIMVKTSLETVKTFSIAVDQFYKGKNINERAYQWSPLHVSAELNILDLHKFLILMDIGKSKSLFKILLLDSGPSLGFSQDGCKILSGLDNFPSPLKESVHLVPFGTQKNNLVEMRLIIFLKLWLRICQPCRKFLQF